MAGNSLLHSRCSFMARESGFTAWRHLCSEKREDHRPGENNNSSESVDNITTGSAEISPRDYSDHGSWQCQNRNENVRIYCLEKLYISICAEKASIRWQKSCSWGRETEKCHCVRFDGVWRRKSSGESGAGVISTLGETSYQGLFEGGCAERKLCVANQIFSGLCGSCCPGEQEGTNVTHEGRVRLDLLVPRSKTGREKVWCDIW